MLETGILLFATLAIVPLGLWLIKDPERGSLAQSLLRAAGRVLPIAAIVLIGGSALPQGAQARNSAILWAIVTMLLACAGVLDLWRRGWRLDGTTAFSMGQIYLAVGGAWTVISRAGWQPQDFSHAIVLLTAVHFHYAGFALPILAGLTANEMERRRNRKPPSPQPSPKARGSLIDRVMLAAILVGVPLVGVGISLSPHVEVAAAVLLACGCVLLAVRQLQVAIYSRSPTRLTLLSISSLSLLAAMALAVVYAAGEFTGSQRLDIPTMVRTHGAANALGFATCGLVGWCSRTRQSPGT